MADETLRRLERRYRETRSPHDAARWLEARVRAGDVTRAHLALASLCGDPLAQAAHPVRRPWPLRTDGKTLKRWARRLQRFGLPDLTQIALLAAQLADLDLDPPTQHLHDTTLLVARTDDPEAHTQLEILCRNTKLPTPSWHLSPWPVTPTSATLNLAHGVARLHAPPAWAGHWTSPEGALAEAIVQLAHLSKLTTQGFHRDLMLAVRRWVLNQETPA